MLTAWPSKLWPLYDSKTAQHGMLVSATTTSAIIQAPKLLYMATPL
jgi:hypothetical protein